MRSLTETLETVGRTACNMATWPGILRLDSWISPTGVQCQMAEYDEVGSTVECFKTQKAPIGMCSVNPLLA